MEKNEDLRSKVEYFKHTLRTPLQTFGPSSRMAQQQKCEWGTTHQENQLMVLNMP